MASKHPNHKPREYSGTAIGMSKHYRSGKTSKPPNIRHRMMIEAQREERKAPPPLPYESVSDLFRH